MKPLLGPDDLMEINIKALHSRTYTFAVETTISVQALKLLIEHNSGIISERQRLLFRGRALNNDLRLSSDYQVEEGHTLYLVETPQGGASAGPVLRSQIVRLEVVNFGFLLVQCDFNSNLALVVIPNYFKIVVRRLVRHFAACNNNNPIPPAELLQEIRQLLSHEVVDFLSILRSLNGRDPSARRWQEGRLVVESGRLPDTLGRLLLALGRANSEATLVCTSHGSPSARRWHEGRLVVQSGRSAETLGRLLITLGRANSEATLEEAALSTSPTGQDRFQSPAHDSQLCTRTGEGNLPLASDTRNSEHVDIASSESQNEVNNSSTRPSADEEHSHSDSEREMSE